MAVFASDATLAGGLESFADYHCRGTTTRAQAVLSAFNPSAAKGLVRALSEFRPDVVHVKMFLWQLSPSILRHLVGRPSVYEIMTYKAICPNGTKVLPGGRRCTHPAGRACLSGGCLTPQTWLAMMLQRHLWMRRMNAFSRLVAVSETVRLRLDENGVGPCRVIPFGWLSTPSGDANALAAAIGRLLADKTLCDEFGRAGREIAREAYTLTADVDAWVNCCRDMIAMPRAGTGS